MAQKRIDYYGRFTPTGVDTAQAERLQALAGVAESIGDIAFDIGAGIAKKRGAEAGAQAGVEAAQAGEQPELRTGFLSELSIFDQQYNKAVTSSYVASLDASIRENVSRIATDNPDNEQSFDQAINQYRAGVLEGMAPEYKARILPTLDSFISSARSRVYDASVARTKQEADDSLIRSITNSQNDSLRSYRAGDQERGLMDQMNAFNFIDDRVAAGFMTEGAAETMKRDIVVAGNVELARFGLEQKLKDGTVSAINYIKTIDDAAQNDLLTDMTVEQADALHNVLMSDLRSHLSQQDMQERIITENNTAMQNARYGELLTGLTDGSVNLTDIVQAGRDQSISATHLSQLLTTYNSRGTGIDDYAYIRKIQDVMYSDPDEANRLIAQGIGSNLTGPTANRLRQDMGNESILNRSDVRRYKNYLQSMIGIDPQKGLYVGEGELRNQYDMILAFEERVLNGESPESVAFELVEMDKQFATNSSVKEIQDNIQLIENRYNSIEDPTPEEDERFNTEHTRLENSLVLMQRYEAMISDIKASKITAGGGQ